MAKRSHPSTADGRHVNQDQETLQDAHEQMAQGLAPIQGALRQREEAGQQDLRREMQDALRTQEEKMMDSLRRQAEEAKQRTEEALRVQEQKAERKLQEALSKMEEKMQEKEEAIRTLERRVKDTVSAAEGPMPSSESEGIANTRGGGDVPHLEERMRNLESSVEGALQTVSRVEVLAAHEDWPPVLPPPPSPFLPFSYNFRDSGASESPRPSSPVASSSEAHTGGVNLQPPKSRDVLGRELLEAAMRGKADCVRRLLDAGADVNAIGEYGTTPLMWAASQTHEDVVRVLLERGADVQAQQVGGMTALHFAIHNDCSDQLSSLLINAGAPLNVGESNGWTPLHEAVARKNERAVQTLLAAGADRSVTNHLGDTPFQMTSDRHIRRLLRP